MPLRYQLQAGHTLKYLPENPLLKELSARLRDELNQLQRSDSRQLTCSSRLRLRNLEYSSPN